MKNVEIKRDTKDKIFREAAGLFSRDGYYKVSVREICEAAGVTKPVLYYYFRDKENLLLEMIKETRKIIEDMIGKYVKPEDRFVMQLEGIIKFYIDFLHQYPHLMKFSAFIQFMAAPENVKKYKYDSAKKDWTELTGIFIKAQENNELIRGPEPLMLARSFIGSIITILSGFLMGHMKEDQVKTELYDFLNFWIAQFVIKNK